MAYEYRLAIMRGSSELSTLLRELSIEGWEPVNFSRYATVEYEVILRRVLPPGQKETAVLEQLENAIGTIDAPTLPGDEGRASTGSA